MEWLYLALVFSKNKKGKGKAKFCLEKECRAKKGNVFALCDFIAADKDVMIVDLTMGEKWNPHRQQHEIRRLVKSSQRKKCLTENRCAWKWSGMSKKYCCCVCEYTGKRTIYATGFRW